MTSAASIGPVLHRANEPILLDEIRVTHINGCALLEPIRARVTLQFFPETSCRIESKDLPRRLIKLQHDAFAITTEDGFETKVVLAYDLNELFRSSNSFSGYLNPVESPCTVLNANTNIQSVSFGILNFPPFYERNDKWIDVDGTSRRLGCIEMQFDGYRMQITENEDFAENRKLLGQQNGFSVTHTGQIHHVNGGSFSAELVGNILRTVRAFLSFSRGAACGLTLVRATLPNGEERLLQWGTTHTEPWLCGCPSWLPRIEGGDILGRLFPKFYDLCRDSNWKSTSSTVIDWYLNANVSPFHVGIILAQAALESLSFTILGQYNGPAHQGIANALRGIGVDTIVPKVCEGLSRWITLLQSEGKIATVNGPRAITIMRNDLVHATKRYGRIPWRAQMDTLSLAQWYIEIMLLHQLGHVGPYRNRISESTLGQIENYPLGGR